MLKKSFRKLDCLFCNIYQRKEFVIFENRFFYSQFDRFPVSPGHAEVIPNHHIESLTSLNNRTWRYLKSAINQTIRIIESSDLEKIYENFIKTALNEKSKEFCEKMLTYAYINKKPEGYNIGVNERRAAGRTIDHLHIHIIPRYSGDVKNPIGGIRNIIPGMGDCE